MTRPFKLKVHKAPRNGFSEHVITSTYATLDAARLGRASVRRHYFIVAGDTWEISERRREENGRGRMRTVFAVVERGTFE